MYLKRKDFHGYVNDEVVLARLMFKVNKRICVPLPLDKLPEEYSGIVDLQEHEIIGSYSPSEWLQVYVKTVELKTKTRYAICKVLVVSPEELEKLEKQHDKKFLLALHIEPY